MTSRFATEPKKAATVSIAEALLSAAADLGVDVSQAAEAGLAAAVSAKCAEIWLQENAEAIAAFNAYTEQNGLPLDEFRKI